ncbi:hypothetical protein HBI81_039660 [Parastagonospora nodorum]|nr:hypothetical protein HBH53_112710 [Parastagonospora nodorum]KAH4044811.1 hypothetical protein HBH49_213560 [Parastagonospora nodorum]KAH4095349.1 hypothetical protein HBH46_168860 [Parastagonospora nodorum]KAH4183972.1 hypothetical protein HBH42_195970 [Parastagonospora nodorum]KAH4601202.1 hypothetical protein HBH82_178960 [Parastagonospora nodorum]
MDLESLSRAQTMGSSDADMDDTPASSVHESDLEDEEEEEEEEEEEDVPLVTLHPRIGHNVNAEFDCPLKELSPCILAAAQESARQGCPQCTLRTTAISEIFPSLPDSTELRCSHDYLFLPFHIQGQRIVLASYDHAPGDDVLICNVYGHRIGGLAWVERIVPCNTDLPESLETVKRWIMECDDAHDCTSNAKTNLPRRLLDVRNNSVRVHEITHEDEGTKYACLSHCWGYPPNKILCNTLATFNDYRQAVPWEKLPKTFRDAISFTRKLGVPFLWIDSLCIVQNDKDKKDWQEQSANMANIYRNAYITLAATAAKDSDGGLYTSHDVPPTRRIGSPLLTVQFPDGSERQLFARRNFDHDTTSLPLLKRGWAYQERLLSPRVLHFVGEEVIWECNHALTCECGGGNLEYAMERPPITDSSKDDEFRSTGPHSRHPAPLDFWYRIVGEYCALSLTQSSDIFPALSGIAKVFAAEIDDDYVAGMWRQKLVSNLLWYFTAREQQPSTSKWRAPSWSWASSSQHSDFRVLPTTEELASVLEVTAQPSGVDPTGELAAASLALRTKAIPATFHASTQTIQIDDFSIPLATKNLNFSSISGLYTAYFDLASTSHTSIILAQLAKCTGERRPYLHDVHEPIYIQQEVRSYMILACHGGNYTRIGLATIAAYDPNTSLYPTPCPDERVLLSSLTRSQIQARFEDTAQLNRRIFKKFDSVEERDLILL